MALTTESNRLRQADELLLVESMFQNEFHWITEPDPEQERRDPEFEITLPNPSYALHFVLPYNYPETSLPIVFLNCESDVPNITRSKLRKRLIETLESLPKGQESIDVLLANFTEVLMSEPTFDISKKDKTKVSEEARDSIIKNPVITRVILWFHHLLSTQKRHQIVNWSKSLHLSGYSRPGYPGALFVEGEKTAIENYISQLKGLKWQAIKVRAEQDDVSGKRIFSKDAGVIELESLSDIAGSLREKGSDELEEWFLVAMKIK